MYNPLIYFTFLSFLYVLAFAFTVPQPITLSNNSTPQTFHLPSDTGLGVCDPPRTLHHSLGSATFSDCQKAIRHRLPYFPGRANFHTKGDDDAFRLPIFKTWGTCNVTVVLGGVGAVTDESSWLEIGYAATEVNEVCRYGEFVGGKIMTGLGKKVWVKLGRVEA